VPTGTMRGLKELNEILLCRFGDFRSARLRLRCISINWNLHHEQYRHQPTSRPSRQQAAGDPSQPPPHQQ